MSNSAAQPVTAAPQQTASGNGPVPTNSRAIVPDRQSRLISMNRDQAFCMALEPKNLEEAWHIAEELAKHKLFRIKSPAEGMARIMTGRGLGLPMYASLVGIFGIEDKSDNDNGVGIGMYAKLKVAICLHHPECRYFKYKVRTAEKSVWVTKRGDNEEQEVEFTIQMAQDASLLDRGKTEDGKKGNNWNRWKMDMLSARASGRLADLVYPDALMGLPSFEDLQDANVIETTGEPVTDDTPSTSSPPPQAAPTRDFAAEAEMLKAKMTAAVGGSEDEQRTARAALKKFIEDPGSEPYRRGLHDHYQKTIPKPAGAPAAQGAPPPGAPSSGSAAQSNVEPTLFTSAPAGAGR